MPKTFRERALPGSDDETRMDRKRVKDDHDGKQAKELVKMIDDPIPVYDLSAIRDIFNGDTDMVSIQDIQTVAMQRHMKYVSSPHVLLETNDNDIKEQIRGRADLIMRKTLRGTTTYFLTPAQRARIYLMCNSREFDFKVKAKVELQQEDDNPETIVSEKCTLEGSLGGFKLVCDGTGCGKTIMTAAAAVQELFDEDVRLNEQELFRHRYTDPETDICDGDGTHTQIANVCFFYAAKNLTEHWITTLEGMQPEIARLYRKKIQIWVGKKSKYSLRAAFESGEAICWVLPLQTDSISVLEADPKIAYKCRVFDEFMGGFKRRKGRPTSKVIGTTFIAQATLERLNEAMRMNPEHPLRLQLTSLYGTFMINSLSTIQDLKHKEARDELEKFVKLRLFAGPLFMRDLVSRDAAKFMPQGVKVHTVSYRIATFAGMLSNRDSMTPMSFVDLIKGYLAREHREEIAKNFASGIVDIRSLRAALENMHSKSDTFYKNKIQCVLDRLSELRNGSAACCICYDALSAETACMTKCCTAIYCRACINRIERCALCRSPTLQVVVDAKPQQSAPPTPSVAPPPPSSLREKLHLINKENMTLVPAFARAILAAATPGARLLVFFKNALNDNINLFKELDELLPTLVYYNFEKVSGNTRDVNKILDEYRASTDYPIALMCSNDDKSSSIAGVDLKETTATIVDGQMTHANKMQLIGRVLRMGKGPTPASTLIITKGQR